MTGPDIEDRPASLSNPHDVVRSPHLAWADLLASLRDVAPGDQAPRGTTLNRERDVDDHVAILESGFCIAVKRAANGQQQNVALHVPGDIINHESFTLGAATSAIVAITPVVFHRLSHAHLRALMVEDERLARGFWRYVAFQGALAQEWIFSMGRRPAYERTAHLFCELVSRMRAVGGSPTKCEFPLTQTDLADLLGLSVVHINRTLQRLRQDGYIALRRGTLEVRNWPALVTLAGFDTFYLDLAAGV